ncbi:MAG: YceI family protein [Hyphomonadaceae bacterium]|nr:YceI family protein [Hyphomonadaceae bacterium]
MKQITLLSTAAAAVLIAACGSGDTPAEAQVTPEPVTVESAATAELDPALADVTPGAYVLDRNHAFLTFTIGHSTGISDYKVDFADFDAELDFDPADPTASSISVTINPAELMVNFPGDYKASHADSEFDTWQEDLAYSDRFLNADEFPEITFTSTAIEVTGANTGMITGDLTFLGQTKPVTMDVTFNGVAVPPWAPDSSIVGFNATTTITRSEWGMGAAMGWLTDEVVVEFSGEFAQAG